MNDNTPSMGHYAVETTVDTSLTEAEVGNQNSKLPISQKLSYSLNLKGI